MAVKQKFSRRQFLKLLAKGSAGVALTSLGGFVYTTQIEPGWIDVVQQHLTLPHLSAAFDGFRIVQISDLHTDNVWMTRDRLISIVNLVNQQTPDLVVLTGDFVTQNPIAPLLPDIEAALTLLKPPTLAILGNHDHWTDATAIHGVIKNSGLIDLSNAVHIVRRGEATLSIGGVDDIWEKQDRLDLVLNQLPSDGAAILLAHEPDFADTAAQTGRFDLQLSEHSHGGQVILPFYGPAVRINLAQKYPLGLYHVGTMLQYTNRGLGMVSPRVRFNCRPEMTVFTLAAGAA